jgi:two-component system NarL family sensor kinase
VTTRRGASRTADAVRLAGVPVALLAVALASTAVAAHLGTPAGSRSDLLETPEVTVGPTFAVVGAVVLRLGATPRLPGLLLLIGTAASTYAAAVATAAATGGAGALGHLAAWLASWTWAAAFLPFALLLPLLFPDGRTPSPRWRPLAVASTAITVLVCLTAAVSPGPVAGLPALTNPLGVPALDGVRSVVEPSLVLVVPPLALAGLVSLVLRARRADGDVRRQVAWFGYGCAVALLASFVADGWLLHLGLTAVPVAIAVAVLRYRLYEIDRIVVASLVGAVLLAGAAVVYAAVVGWAGAALSGRGALPSFLAAVTVAVLFHPARLRVQRAVNRVLYGERADPYALLVRLAERLQDAGSARQALGLVTTGIAEGLRLPAVWVDVVLPDGSHVLEHAGEDGLDPAASIPLTWHGEELGTLSVAARAGRSGLDRLDEQLLSDLAGQVGAVAYALRLGADLTRSHESLVGAVAEERRRLRRDLHDGLGPELSGVVLGLATAERALDREEVARARELVAGTRDQVQSAVADIRRLVHGLRPPALDDLGLVEALRTTGPAAASDLVHVSESAPLPPLPAAVEVAAYRIAQEAVTNALRHGRPARVDVVLDARPDGLVVEVVDDGVGLDGGAPTGVGLQSMRERAEELGGRCAVEPRPTGGTRVLAHLPWGGSVVPPVHPTGEVLP